MSFLIFRPKTPSSCAWCARYPPCKAFTLPDLISFGALGQPSLHYFYPPSVLACRANSAIDEQHNYDYLSLISMSLRNADFKTVVWFTVAHNPVIFIAFWPSEPSIIVLLTYNHIIPPGWPCRLQPCVRQILFTSALGSTLLRLYCSKQWCHISQYPNGLFPDIYCICPSYVSSISTYTMTAPFSSCVLSDARLGVKLIHFHPEISIATDDMNPNWPVTRLPSCYFYTWHAIMSTHCPP